VHSANSLKDSVNVLSLCAILEYTSEEAAQLLHVNAGTVRAHIHHARKALQEAQQIVPSTTKNS